MSFFTKHTTLYTALLVACISCRDDSLRENTAPEYEITTESHTAALSDRNYVDIIWVIDDSGSMAPYQEAVADNFTTFIDNFAETQLDFRFSVISTSVDGGEAPDGRMNNTPSSLTSDALKRNPTTFSRNFRSSVQIGTTGSADEQAMWNIKRHFERHGPNSNDPYLREYAQTIVFYLSDERDYSGNDPSANEPKDPENPPPIDDTTGPAYLEHYKATLGTDNIKFFAILKEDLNDARWVALTESTGGSISSIDGDYSVTLNSLGSYVVQQQSYNLIYLEKPAKSDGTMVVRVNGSEVPSEQWKFYWENQLIQIDEAAINEGDSVEVDFETQTNPNYIPSQL